MVRTDGRTHGRTDVTNGLTEYFWGALHNSPSGNKNWWLFQLVHQKRVSRSGTSGDSRIQ